MENAEWRQLVREINLDIGGIIRGQRTLDEVNEELRGRKARPIEEDFIYADALGHDPGVPRKLTVDGVEIETRTLHRRGIRQRDVKGADLLYEITGRKFILVQYKAPIPRNRVKLDRPQLKKLMGACPNPCPPHLPIYTATCGSWYAVRSKSISAYVPACKAAEFFDDADSCSAADFGPGLSHENFQKAFARCWTGARVAKVKMTYLSWVTSEADRVLFRVIQRGSFGRL
jgi:hypothetical protein